MAWWLCVLLWVVGAAAAVALGVIAYRRLWPRVDRELRRRLRGALHRCWRWLRAHKAPCVFVVVLALAALAVLAVWRLPQWRLAPYRGELGLDEYLALENSVRTSVIQAIGGLAVLIGLYFNWRRVELARQQQITEPYARAIEQLGSKSLEVRLAGIYALERIARGSEKDHWTIMEILTAFVRRTVPWVEPKPAKQLSLEGRPERAEPGEPPSLRTDIQALLKVLGRRRREFEIEAEQRLDLHHIDLRGAELSRLRLEGANLSGAHLEKADLSLARFEGADLSGAHLEGAVAVGAHLQEADLSEARLQGAELSGAHLSDANLSAADLKEVSLRRAALIGADLSGAQLQGADLSEAALDFAMLEQADLGGAWLAGTRLAFVDLSRARNVERSQIRAALVDSSTILPDHLTRSEESETEEGTEGGEGADEGEG